MFGRFVGPIAPYLGWAAAAGTWALAHADGRVSAFLFSTAIVTTVPLLLFAAAARALTLTTLGLFQYLGPTVQFALGVWFYHEPLGDARASSFAHIWLGLAIYTVDGLRSARQRNAPSVTAAVETGRG